MKTFIINCILFSTFLASHDIQAQNLLYRNEFPLLDVILLDGPFKHALRI